MKNPGRAVAALLFALAPVVAQSPAVVHVFVEVQGQPPFKLERPSSGVIVDAAGLVVTHADLVREGVAAGDKQVVVQLADLARTRMAAQVLALHAGTGLALLRVEVPTGLELSAAPLRAAPPPGTPAVVLSFHDGEDHVAFAGVTSPAQCDVAVSAGAGAPVLARADILVTDAAIQARSHGAALLAADGGLLGLCSAAFVAPDVSEPTLEDLKRPSFGFVLAAPAIRAAFAAELAHLPAPAPAPASPEAAAAAAVARSIVAVYAGDAKRPNLVGDPQATQRRPRIGSGVVVSADGKVLTDLHLVERVDAITLTWLDGTTCAAERVSGHGNSNTALLQARLPAGRRVEPIAFAERPPAVGATLLAVGNPEGHGLTIGRGVLSALRNGWLQTDAPLGNHTAGGALIDLRGRLVGLVDGGRIDPIDIAWRHRGERAKLDTSLNLAPRADTLRGRFEFEARTAAPLDGPTPGVTERVVAKVGDATLNLFVEATAAPAEVADNPFAEATTATTVLSLGSGVVIDPRGIALTNWHVVDDATFSDGSMRQDRVLRATRRDGRSFRVQVLSLSREEDLALLRLETEPGEQLPAAEFGSSDALRVGDPTVAMGNPHGRIDTVTAGIVTAKNQAIRVRGRWAKLRQLLETDAAINGGNSGGPLFDGEGRLIGINSAGGDLRAVTGFAIGADHVRERLHGLLLSPAKLRSAWLGFEVAEAEGAVVVQAVDRDGPATGTGLVPGDAVVALGDTPTPRQLDFALAMVAVPAGEPLRVRLRRAGAAQTVQVTPWPAAVWAVFKQTRLLVGEVSHRDEAALVHAAALAAHRRLTGDPASAPAELSATAVRIAGVHPLLTAEGHDIQAGDILLAARLRARTASGEVTTLVPFASTADVQRCGNEHATYDGTPLELWLYRPSDQRVRDVRLTVHRLML